MSAEGRERARRAVTAEMAVRRWNPSDLAREAGIDPGTAGDFLSGARWVKLGTQGKIEAALGWDAGTIDAYASGFDVTEISQDATHGVVLDLPPEATAGLSPVEMEEMRTAARLAALQTAREIRKRLDGGI